ncbi:MAG: hypothetical protein IPJ81_11905 [Chitinophagaceae bacterium]|jgi:hypothetical protein|nr:hypothetical protein [Chitinophagaceae bacterium]
MAKILSKNASQQTTLHIVETNEVFAINCKYHSGEANELVVSDISILETTDALI